MKKKKTACEKEKCDADSLDDVILFNTQMRKTFVEGVLQDVKGYFESKTNGKVEVSYEDFNLKNHEFGFKMLMSKEKDCTKQMFSEASSAFVNIINYMFSGESDQYDVSFSSSNDKVELEIVSNW